MECNLRELEELTGASFKTLKKRLEKAGLEPVKTTPKGNFYNPQEALKAIYTEQNSEELNLQEERAKLARAQTEKTQYEADKMKEKLICAEEVKTAWAKYINNVRSKFLLLPLKISKDLKGISETKDIENILEENIYLCLVELSQGGTLES